MSSFCAEADVRTVLTRAGEDLCADGADVALYLRRLFLPLWRVGGICSIAVADNSAENLCWLRAAYGDVRILPAPKSHIVAEIGRRYNLRMTDDAMSSLAREHPALSAHRVTTPRQVAVLVLFAAAALACAAVAPIRVLSAFVVIMSLFFLAGTSFRVVLSWLGGLRDAERSAPSPQRQGVALPRYSILVPLYREARIVPGLIQALSALEYPRERLDIKLIVEADDLETASACDQVAGEAHFEVVRVPPSLPRTKPKAINFALRHARGEFLVIYDAEDRPEPDQLLKAVAAFRAASRTTACLQARLAFYNADDCWLTKLFALDYGIWFETLLPGLERIGVPIPLGGTSNHFRTAVLRAIGAWDPFNVTEDADIGIRLAQLGYRVSMLDSTTYEEAPTQIAVWIRQRSRWLKGYMQTCLVHGRGAVAPNRHIGVGGFVAFQLFIGGAVLSALINPILWTIFALSYVVPIPLFGDFPGYASAIGALGSNGLLTYLAVAGSARRGDGGLAPYGLTVAVYWVLISIAGYRGLWHLIVKPFHWEKTAHGLSDAGSHHG